MVQGSGSDPTEDPLISMGHENLGHIVEMITLLDQLWGRGWLVEDIAAEMASKFTEAPGGGVWDEATVTKVLSIVNSMGDDSAEHHGQDRWSEPLEPVAGMSMLDGGSPPKLSDAERSTSQGAAYPEAFDEWQHLSSDDADTDRRWPALARVAAGGIVLAAIGASVYAAFNAAGSDESAVPVPTSHTGAGAEPDTTEAPDPADMMAIRVEPAAPETSGTSSDDLVAATATVRADGLLHFEGAFRTQQQADEFVSSAAGVFGRENIVESYVINASAPVAQVSDVALDKPVLFETGTATIDPSYIPFLEACGDVLRLNPHITMSIAAFTDSTGDDDFNLELSQQRAQAIVDFYRQLEIPDVQLIGEGFGEADPVAENTTDSGRQQNRRAMLQLLNVMDERS